MRIFLTDPERQLMLTALDMWVWKLDFENSDSASHKPQGGHWYAGRYTKEQIQLLKTKLIVVVPEKKK